MQLFHPTDGDSARSMLTCLPVATVLIALIKEISADGVLQTDSVGQFRKSMWGLSAGVQSLVYLALASSVVLLVGFLLYCITCMKGPSKRQRRVRRQDKPSTIVVRPAIKKTNQQYYAQRVVRPVEQPVRVQDYETHSLTMYIPPED